MLKKQLILRDPIKFLGHETDEALNKGGFGAVIARAGVGKTAFLVQIALNALLREKYVLHISTQDPVDKVNLWYKEIFNKITCDFEAGPCRQLWEDLLVHRFIMTFETEKFNLAKVTKRIDELQTQNIFSPSLVIIDGLSVNKFNQSELSDFKAFAQKHAIAAWFSLQTHQHDEYDPEKLLSQLDDSLKDLFDTLIQIIPEKEKIRIKKVVCRQDEGVDLQSMLCMDPSTMLIKEDAL